MSARMRRLWEWVRALSGDDAYERYLAHHRRCHPADAVLGRREFCAREQDRRWSGVSRCC